MKCILLILLASMMISCGKKSDNDDPNQVTSTPPVLAEDPVENIIENQSFSITSDKEEYAEGEAVLLKLKNLGKVSLDHLAFKFGSEPSSTVVSNLNCFTMIEPEQECMFSVVFQNPDDQYQKINITYDELGAGVKLQLNIRVIIDDENQDINFLYRKEHTFSDCEKLYKYRKHGVVTSVKLNDFCKVRAKHWETGKRVEIDVDPMLEFNDELIDNNKHFCEENWTLSSLQFAASEVIEVKNIFGGKRTVEIPAGESREVCVKRNLFGCKTKKVFYSRLMSANCY